MSENFGREIKYNYYCFLDESFDERVFCLGGIFIEENKIPETLKKWRELKGKIGLNEIDHLKWSLGDKGKEKKIKEKIKKFYRSERDWLTTFRRETLTQISQLNLKLIASLHQNVKRSRQSTVDFYIWAFKFLLQRIWWMVKDEKQKHIFVIVDKPPEAKNFRGAESKIYECFQEVYERGFKFDDRRIPPLKDSGFFECLFVAKNDFSSFIQISDFCVGVLRQRARDLLQKSKNETSKEFLKLIINLFHKTNEGDIIGRGLIVFPKDQTLHQLIKNDIDDILKAINKDEISF